MNVTDALAPHVMRDRFGEALSLRARERPEG